MRLATSGVRGKEENDDVKGQGIYESFWVMTTGEKEILKSVKERKFARSSTSSVS